MAEINDLQEKLAAQQIETMEGNEQKRIEGLKSLNEAAAALEQYESLLLFLLNSGFLTEILFCHPELFGSNFDGNQFFAD